MLAKGRGKKMMSDMFFFVIPKEFEQSEGKKFGRGIKAGCYY